MPENWPLTTGDVLSQFFLDPLQDFIAPITAELNLLPPNAATLQVAPGSAGSVAVGIGGLWRHREAATSSPVSGAAGTYDVYVVASARNITSGGATDSTDYTFGLVLVSHGAAAPTGTYNGNAITQTRKIGEVDWDGSANITGLRQLVGPNVTLPITPTAPIATVPAVRARAAAGQSVPVARWENSSGTQIAAVNPDGKIVATTPAIDDSSTFVATTAYVLGQASSASPTMAGAAAAGTSTRWSRADHVHPTDTSRAPLNSPALTGTPTAPTPAVSDNSTRIATTAYVLGQASSATPQMDGAGAAGTANTWSRADHVHPTDTSRAPTASPTLTGSVTLTGSGKTTLALTSTTTPTGLTIGGDATLYRSAASTLKTDGELDVAGVLRHLGSQLGFYNAAAVAQPSARTVSNAAAALRTIDRNSFTTQNLFDLVATIITDLQNVGLFA